MLYFLQQQAGRVIGFLKGWDRLRLRGTLRCLAHGKGVASYLLRKLPHTHRYVVSEKGRQVVAAMAAARNADISQLTKPA